MGKGDFIRNPDRRVKLVVLTQIFWAVMLLVLAIWWGTLLLQQSEEIANLQTQLGSSPQQVQSRLNKMERMVVSESGTFVVLFLITNGVLVGLYLRDSKRSKSLSAFFASITHELRTPLTSIKLQAEAIRDIDDHSKQLPFLTRLLEDAERLEGQVQKTLELARIEGGGDLHRESIPLRSFLQNRVLPYYSNNNGKLDLHLEMSSEVVAADPTAITIIFRNLMDNAIKYTRNFPAQVTVKGYPNSHFLDVEVSHHNSVQPTVNPNELGKLFVRGTNSQGAGVGLYLIKTLMQKMMGKASFAVHEHEFKTKLHFKMEAKA